MTLPNNELSDYCASFGPFRLSSVQRVLLEDGLPVKLGSRAFDILATLVERAGETIGKNELIARVWPDTVVEEANLRVHVAALRKALRDSHAPAGGQRYIENIAGRGYCFIAPVQLRAESAVAAAAPAAAPTPIHPRQHGLPASLSNMIGREDIVKVLAERLGQQRLVSVVGCGGIGKTTVALAVAAALAPAYRQPPCFVDLALVTEAAGVPAALAAALGLPVLSAQLLPGLTAYLRERHMLILLDNCEHVIEAAAALAEHVLQHAPEVRILATSRESLRAADEWVQRLKSLDMPGPDAQLSVAQALTYPAIELFTERARAVLDSFTFCAADLPAIADICRKLDGVPLAIELAAARIDLFNVRELAARLEDRFLILNRGRRTALPRHRTLRAVLDWSYEILSPQEQAVLRRLAVFRGEFTLASAVAVASGGDIGGDQVDDAVITMTAKSLVSAEQVNDAVSCRLLDTTRAYAQEKLAASDERQAVWQRFARHCSALLAHADAEWDELPSAQWRARYGRRIDDVRAALDWAFGPDGNADCGIHLAVASIPLWVELSLLEEQRGLLEKALRHLRAGAAAGTGSEADAVAEMKLCAALGNVLYHIRGGSDETAAAFTRAFEIAERLGDIEQLALTFSGLCGERLLFGDYPFARRLAERFEENIRHAGSKDAQIIYDRMIALTLHLSGDQDAALVHAQRVLNLPLPQLRRTRNTGVQHDQYVAVAIVLARVLWLQGAPEQAARVAQQAVQRAQEINHTISLCYALAAAAFPIAWWSGDRAAAERSVEALLDSSARHAMVYWHSWGCAYRAVLSGRIPADTGSTLQMAAFGPLVENLATMDLRFVDADSIERVARGRSGWCAPEITRAHGELILAGGAENAAPAAEQAFQQALTLARAQQALAWELRAATSLARLWHGQQRTAEARALLADVHARFREGHGSADLRAAAALLAQMDAPRSGQARVFRLMA